MSMSADNRFVRKPYTKFAYPYQVYYPAYTYPKKPIEKVNTSSLKSVTKNAMKNVNQTQMKPYVFRHYIPPTGNEMWDYNKKDLIEAQYNEMLRLQIAQEVYDAPGSYRKVRR